MQGEHTVRKDQFVETRTTAFKDTELQVKDLSFFDAYCLLRKKAFYFTENKQQCIKET